MARKIKRIELANGLGISRATITMSIKRGGLISEPDKTINIDNEVNKIWLSNQKEKHGRILKFNGKTTLSKSPKKRKVKPAQEKRTQNDQQKIIYPDTEETTNITKRKLIAEAKIKERSAEKLKLEIQKKKGELVPFEAVKSVFIYAVETFRSSYLQEVNNIAQLYIHRTGGSHKELIELKKDISENIQNLTDDIRAKLIEGLTGIVEEFREVRGRGESK